MKGWKRKYNSSLVIPRLSESERRVLDTWTIVVTRERDSDAIIELSFMSRSNHLTLSYVP